jgi:glutamate-1-semialdehyde 2,1-aminomutase
MKAEISRNQSKELYDEALNYFPGGVNSPVRAFRAVGGNPLFIKKGDGAYLWDEDDNQYIDFCCSWGPLILGHRPKEVVEAIEQTLLTGTSFGAPTKLENTLAKLILDNNPYIEKIRFVNSGTEAVMSAIRLARGYTGRDKIIKFEGCYHGHTDSLLVKAGSGLVTFGNSSSAGVPKKAVEDTLVLPLNNKEALEMAIAQNKGEIACIILEPIPANNGLLLQDRDFLVYLREVCDREGILLFFDEVISGFRVGFQGAAGHYDIKPDLVSYGKIIGGGLPVGAYGGKAEIMKCVAPEGDVYQAGTLSGNPMAMAAGIAQLKACLKSDFYSSLEEKTNQFTQEIQRYADEKGFTFKIFAIGSIFWVSFSDKEKISAADDIDATKMGDFALFHQTLLNHGVYVGPSGYEVGFISREHTQELLNEAIEAFKSALDAVYDKELV